jgi:hypothetical protein
MNQKTRSKDEEIQDNYFAWLCKIVAVKNSDKSRLKLLSYLHDVPFRWTIPNDDNRGEDGKNLRIRFSDDHLEEDCDCLDGPCTVLEMLVALAQRMEYLLEDGSGADHTGEWFDQFIENLQLGTIKNENDHILNVFMDRIYGRKGDHGGLFPLKRSPEDQRNVELWYQLMHYVEENYGD